MQVLAIIPARSGSKSLRHKNIRITAGKPLIAWSIEHALATKEITRTIVSTDSPEYAEIAKSFGAEVPFLRPASLSGDFSTDFEVFDHALRWLEAQEGYRPDICVHLRPTHPVRDPADIGRMVEILVKNPAIDSVRSVAPAPQTPFKMWFRDANGLLKPVVETTVPEPYNQPRQALPPTYLQNASIDVVRAKVILEQRSMTGQKIYGYLMDRTYDIDDEAELRRAAEHLLVHSANGSRTTGLKTFVFDIDGVIATVVPSLDYNLACPISEMIRAINSLHAEGHRIVLFTARGTRTGKNWQDVTLRQLREWGVKHDELLFGKPAADYYIDDKALSIAEVLVLANQSGIAEQLSDK